MQNNDNLIASYPLNHSRIDNSRNRSRIFSAFVGQNNEINQILNQKPYPKFGPNFSQDKSFTDEIFYERWIRREEPEPIGVSFDPMSRYLTGSIRNISNSSSFIHPATHNYLSRNIAGSNSTSNNSTN